MPEKSSSIGRLSSVNPDFSLVRFKRAVPGAVSAIDAVVEAVIIELQKILSPKHLQFTAGGTPKVEIKISNGAGGPTTKNIQNLLKQDFDDIKSDLKKSTDGKDSFGDVIRMMNDGELFYKVQDIFSERKLSLNAAQFIGQESIFEFLFCVARYGKNFREAQSIADFILDEKKDGALKSLNDEVVLKAVKKIRDQDKIFVKLDDEEGKDLIKRLQDMNLSFAQGSFSDKIRKELKPLVFDSKELGLINKAEETLDLCVRDEEYPAVINFFKSLQVENETQAEHWLPIAISQIRSSELNFSTTSDTSLGDADFAVNYYEDDRAQLEFNRENIMCAAQAYYVMTLADEAEIFNVVRRIVTHYLPAGVVDIRSRETLRNLQLYLFADSFRDIKTGEVYKTTLDHERWQIYAQVFGAEMVEVIEGAVVNTEYQIHWEILMTEVAKYLDKAEKSENPHIFVSRQNIMQAVEDLQYNLSAHCTGLAKIAAPIISKELDFVVGKFLRSEEIIRQLAPNGSGSFWKVIERVLGELRGVKPNITALRNKATMGNLIIKAIADYSPANFEDNAKFLEFVGMVEAFIIASSQIEMSGRGGRRGLEELEEETVESEASPRGNSMNGHRQNGNGAPPKDDWNF